MGIDEKGIYKRKVKNRKYDTNAPDDEEKNPYYSHFKGDPKGGQLAGKTVVWDFKQREAKFWNQLPSYAASTGKSFTPIQIQELMAWLAGEQDTFDSLTKAAGLMTHTTRIESDLDADEEPDS